MKATRNVAQPAPIQDAERISFESLEAALDAKRLGEIARGWRTLHGIGVREAGRLAALDPGYISRLENGEKEWNGDGALRYARMVDFWRTDRAHLASKPAPEAGGAVEHTLTDGWSGTCTDDCACKVSASHVRSIDEATPQEWDAQRTCTPAPPAVCEHGCSHGTLFKPIDQGPGKDPYLCPLHGQS